MKRNILALCLCLTFLALGGCSQIPISVDPSTHMHFSKAVEKQKKNNPHPLIGIYRAAFNKEAKISKPEEANPVNGDWQFAALQRGADIDFVSLSGYKNFGAMSDQGGSFSINLQGSTIWSVAITDNAKDQKSFDAVYSSLFGHQLTGTSKVDILDDGWVRIQTTYTSSVDNSKKFDTFFMRKLN